MSLPAIPGLDSALLMHYVLEPALRSLALAGLVWLLLGAFRVRDVSFRLAVWTAVLYAALAMPLLGRLLPQLPVLVPVKQAAQTVAINRPMTMPPANGRAAAAPAVFPVTTTAATDIQPTERTTTAASVPASAGRSTGTIAWLAIGMGIYCLIVSIFLGRFALGFALSRRLRRSSRPIEDARLGTLLASEMRKARLKKAPQVAQSGALSVPATLGVLRPVVLLPERWSEWSETQISAVLAHELSHIARRDALTQMLSGFHRAFFWFSPLSWWLDRALVDLAEQASDDAALRAGADRARYAEVLLHFFRALKTARGRVRWQAVSMAQGARSARRLERILSGARVPARLGQTALVAVALAVVPLVCLAAAVRPSLMSDGQVLEPPTFAPPPAPILVAIPAVIAPSERTPAVPAEPVTPEARRAKPKAAPGVPAPPPISPPPTPLIFALPAWPAPPALVVPAEPRVLAWFFAQQQKATAPHAAEQVETEWLYSSPSNWGGDEAFAIVSGSGIVECGSLADMPHVRGLRGSIPGGFLWFRKNGRSYIIRDPATVKAALAAFTLQKTFARQQAKLDQERAELESQRAEFRLHQAQIRIGVPDLSAEMRRLEAAMRQFHSSATQDELKRAQKKVEEARKALDSSATLEQLSRAQAQLAAAMQQLDSSQMQLVMRRVQQEMAAMQSQLGSLQEIALKKQAEFGRQQAALSKQEAALAGQMAKAARQQAELARHAAEQVRRLIDQAIARGLAKPE